MRTLKIIQILCLTGLFFLLPVQTLLADNGEITAVKTTSTITMDGQETGAEWAGAAVINLTNPTATVKIKSYRNTITNEEELYFIFNITDNSQNPNDMLWIYFDILHNHGSTDDDIGFQVTRDNLMSRLTGSASSATIDGTWTPTTSQFVVVDSPGNWKAEIKIKASQPDLNASFLSSLYGILVYVKDQPTSGFPAEAFWPASGDPYNAVNWANLKIRYPIEYMIVMDQSGSMLSQSKWDAAKKAANFLANTMAIFKNNYFDDKLGVVTFSWINPATDNTSNPKPLATVGTFPIGDYVPAPPVLAPQGSYYTPIGKGLDSTFTALGTSATEQTQRTALLLSDGLHNRPTTDVPLVPSLLSYYACSNAGWSNCTDSVIQVNTVALGEDWGVDTALLASIKNHFSGAFASEYQITNIAGLKSVFINSLQDLYYFNEIPFTISNTYNVDGGNQKLVFILSWDTPGNAQNIELQRFNTNTATWDTVSGTTCARENSLVGYAICIKENPEAGEYRAVRTGTNNVELGDQTNVLIDLRLAARFAIDKKIHGTGQEILLKAFLKEDGAPVTHDAANHPVKVTVTIKRPGEGFGTYVSTHTNCQSSPPVLPPVTDDFLASRPGNTLPASSPANTDVKPSRFDKIDNLFKECNKDGLLFIEDPGIELYDDGTHGDEIPNDGIYTLKFINTQYEGSYVFRFKAAGISPKGSKFARVKTVAEYVRVEVDPGETDFSSRDIQRSKNMVTKEVYVIPRDRFRGYLGPGYPHLIKFETTAGAFVGGVRDYNNGIYSIWLSYDEAKESPEVSVNIQDKPFKPIRFGKPYELTLFAGWTWWKDTLYLEDGPVIGAKLGYHWPWGMTLELEAGLGFTEVKILKDKGNWLQLFGNLRYQLPVAGPLKPFVTAGAGYVIFRGFPHNDNSFALQWGAGLLYKLTSSFGLRIDGRFLRLTKALFGAASGTTNFQACAGLVFWF